MASDPLDLEELELEVREHGGLGGGQSLVLIREARKLRVDLATAEAHRLNIAMAVGIFYETEAGHPGPDDTVSAAVLDLRRRAEKAEENYRFMVERAADEKLDGYRELAQKLCDSEGLVMQLRAERERVRAVAEEELRTPQPINDHLRGRRNIARKILETFDK